MSAMSPMRWASVVTRALAILLVIVSPWLSPTRKPSNLRSVVYVVDRSASMGQDRLAEENAYLATAWVAAAKDDVRLGVVAFDGRAELVAPVGTDVAPTVRNGSEPMASDLAAAIRLAAASLPPEGHRAMVLLTDARPTRGDAVVEVHRAAKRGIRVDVVPFDGETPPLPAVVSIKARAAHVAEHQPVSLEVEVRSRDAFALRWTRDGVALPPRHEYGRGEDSKATYELVDADPPPGVHVYEVTAVAFGRGASAGGDGERPHVSSALAAVSVEGKAYAAVFSSSGGVPPVLASVLSDGGLEIRSLPMERIGDAASYSGADLVVLADVRVSASDVDEGALGRKAQAALVDYVEQGGGLFVTGGSFGLAPEYAGTPIARAIPVEIEDRGHVEDPPVALAIMLDRSGSMAASVGTHTKIELAIEASLAAADVLRPTDQVAIASVDTETHWDVPLAPQGRLGELRAGVRGVTAGGGGIYVYTALKDAYAALSAVSTPIRHVILFSDTSDSEQQSEDCPFDGACGSGKTAETLASEARRKGITTTVVGIGEEEAKDTAFLRRLASASGGRFYLTTEGADLRRIFLSETRVLAQSNLREKKTIVSAVGPHPVLEGVDARLLPALAAYVEAGRRSGADTALMLADDARPEGRPLLATWRYGLGKVGAIATDLSQGWGGEWAASSDAAKVLQQTVRLLLRQSNAHRGDAAVRLHDRAVEVEIELPPETADGALPKSIDVFAVERGGASHKLTMALERRGPGRLVAKGRSKGEPIVIARARDARGAAMAEAVGRQDRAAEYAFVGADELFAAELADIGGGRLRPSREESLALTARPAASLVATWPFALVVAAFLVLIDLVLRRLGSTPAKRVDLAAVTRPEALRNAA